MATKIQIVLARLEEDFRVKRMRRSDLGEAPIMERFHKAVGCMWLNRGTETDVAKAEAFAKTEGYTVFTYDTSVRDALGEAKKAVLR